MGQIEVYEWLKKKREFGDDWFSVADIEAGLQEQGYTNGVIYGVRGDVIKLEWSGYLEATKLGKLSSWKRVFRIKAKYIKKASSSKKSLGSMK